MNALDRGAVTATLGAAIGTSNYRAEIDLDRDGSIDADDSALAATDRTALPAGWISDPARAGNPFGYAGYVLNPETELYLVRYRSYDPRTGRWLQKDPAGYVDGMSLYEYVASIPSGFNDPYGLTVVAAPPESDEFAWDPGPEWDGDLERELDRQDRWDGREHYSPQNMRSARGERNLKELENFFDDAAAVVDALGEVYEFAECMTTCMLLDGNYQWEVLRALVNQQLDSMPFGPGKLFNAELGADGSVKMSIDKGNAAGLVVKIVEVAAEKGKTWQVTLEQGGRLVNSPAMQRFGKQAIGTVAEGLSKVAKHRDAIQSLVGKVSKGNVLAQGVQAIAVGAACASKKCSAECEEKMANKAK